jgi:hypothetical protein
MFKLLTEDTQFSLNQLFFDFQRLDRHSLEVSATVLKDILIGNGNSNSTQTRQRQTGGVEDFAEISELVNTIIHD